MGNKVAAAFMWIFTIILGLSMFAIIAINIYTVCFKKDASGKRLGLVNGIKSMAKGDTLSKLSFYASLAASVSFLFLIITGAFATKNTDTKQAFRRIYFNEY